MIVTNEEIGQRIRRLRDSKNISVEDLAEASEKGVDLIYKWERGKREPGLVELQKVARCLGVRTSFILGEDPDQDSLLEPKEALAVLVRVVEEHEQQARQIDLLRGHLNNLAGSDPAAWPDGLAELVAEIDGVPITGHISDISASLEQGAHDTKEEKKRA